MGISSGPWVQQRYFKDGMESINYTTWIGFISC